MTPLEIAPLVMVAALVALIVGLIVHRRRRGRG